MPRLFSRFALLLFLLAVAGPTAAARDTIRLTNGEWEPYQSEQRPYRREQVQAGPCVRRVSEARQGHE